MKENLWQRVGIVRNCVVISLSLFHTVSINKDEVSEYAVLNVKIVRKPRMLACAAAYQIVLDGTQSGAVKNGECAYVSAGIGRHTISFFNKGALNPKKPLSSFDFSVDTESDNIELEIETISLSAVVVARKK